MKNKVQRGDALEYTNLTGVAIKSGDVIPLAASIAVAAVDIAVGDKGTVAVEEVYSLPKLAGEAHAFGDQLHYDPTAKNVRKTSSATTKYAGMCTKAALSADTVVDCKLGLAPISYVAP